MTTEFITPTPYQRGREIARQLAISSDTKGYFETILGNMDEIPVIREDEKPGLVTLGLTVGLVINAPKVLSGLGTSAKNLIYKAR